MKRPRVSRGELRGNAFNSAGYGRGRGYGYGSGDGYGEGFGDGYSRGHTFPIFEVVNEEAKSK